MNRFSSQRGDIAYRVQGRGPPYFLLVHNAGGNHEMMKYTTDLFSKMGKTIVPDLLGHGASSCPQIEYTVEGFAKDLIELCEYENIDHIIFIGLNYGANIGIVMAHLKPELISHLVLIEPPIFMSSWIVKLIETTLKDLKQIKEGSAKETVDLILKKAKDQEREIALKALKMTSPFVKASTYKQLLLWDKKHAFNCIIPTLLIQTSEPFCSEKKMHSIFSKLFVGRVVCSGPWANLEVPDQVHPMIERFLDFI